jgi:hypothetical protein
VSNNTLKPYQTEISFLRISHNIPFEGGELVLLPKYNVHAAYVETLTHQDGFVYPQESETYNFKSYELDPKRSILEQAVPIPNTRRPSLGFPLPASHQLNLANTKRSDNPRFGDAALILQAVGFAYGVRLQFSDWWFDSRVPILAGKGQRIQINDVSDFISCAYRKWKNFSHKNQDLVINLLWMATRLEAYEYPWEQFIFSYMILDGCYRLSVNECGLAITNKHGERIRALCTHFGIFYDQRHQEFIERIVKLRNALFHETLWANHLMGSPGTPNEIYPALHLKKLYKRILAAILDFEGKFTRSPWTYLQAVPFSRQ